MMQASVDDRLRSLELTTEALSRRMDSLVGQRQIISHESSANLEESRQQLNRVRPRLQPIQSPPARAGPTNNTEANGPLANEQNIYYYQPAQPSSTTVLSGQRADFGRNPQGTIHPQAIMMGGMYPPYYPAESAPDNKWQCWSCCMLWWGLITLLGGIAMAIVGTILLVSYLDNICPSQYTKRGSLCCYQNNLYNCYTPQYNGSFSTAIALICCGFVSGIIGICFLARAHRVYRNNNATCC